MWSCRPARSSVPRSSASTWPMVSTRRPPTRYGRTSGGTRSWCSETNTCPPMHTPHRPQGSVPQFVGDPAQRPRTGRGPIAPAVPPRARICTRLHGPIRLENRRFRDLGQPGHVALRRQRLRVRAPTARSSAVDAQFRESTAAVGPNSYVLPTEFSSS